MCALSMICACNGPAEDNGQIDFGDIGNDKFWEGYWEKQFANLIIQTIESNPDNMLSIIVAIQPAHYTEVSYTYELEAEGKVYFDGEEMGVFNIKNPTYPEGDIDLYSYGRYTYLLPLEISICLAPACPA